MESLDLRIFREVAAEKSISRAAENLHYVQSNVTGHIKRLEKELGAVLFLRHGKGVTITDDGKRLLYYANTILDLLDRTAAEFRVDRSFLRIGAPQTLAAFRLPIWMSAYKAAYPNIAVSVKTGGQDALLDALNNSELDCIFAQLGYLPERGKTVFRHEENLRIAAPLNCKETDLQAMPTIVNHIHTCPFRTMLMEWYVERFSRLPQIVELDTVEAMIHSVALGMGITLLPACLAEQKDGIKLFRIDGIDTIALHMMTLRNERSNQVYQFAEIVKSLKKELGGCKKSFA